MINKINEFRLKKPILFAVIIATIFSLFTVICASSIASPFYSIFRSDGFDNDPLYFFYIGKLILQGQKPYIDIYDHKGLYIFYYHTLANLMGGRIGLFILQFVIFGIFYFIFYKAANLLFENKQKPVFIVLAFFFAFETFIFQGGGDVDIQLPFIALILYFYIKGIKNSDFKSFMLGNIIAGILAGIDINLRMSDAIFPFSFVIFYAYYAVKNKKWGYAIRDAGLCLGSLILTCLPAVIIAKMGGFFDEMMSCLFASNASYVLSLRFLFSTPQVFGYILILLATIVFVISIIYLKGKIDKEEWMLYVISFAITAPFELFICLFPHYFIPLLPVILLYLARFISSIPVVKSNKILSKGIVGLTMLTTFVSIVLYPIYFYCCGVYKNDNAVKQYLEKEIGRDRDDVLAIDCGVSFYLNLNYTTYIPLFPGQTWTSKFEDYVIPQAREYIDSGKVTYLVTRPYSKVGKENKDIIDAILKDYNFELITSEMDGAKYIDLYKLI